MGLSQAACSTRRWVRPRATAALDGAMLGLDGAALGLGRATLGLDRATLGLDRATLGLNCAPRRAIYLVRSGDR
ncbi:hypothetical protein [Nocardia sp. NPDC050793]|uniref:hypothetical protein n=1 Tax=Nocardia sp. NPDC050793 TaxID=3155159 RepID=UPI0033D52145